MLNQFAINATSTLLAQDGQTCRYVFKDGTTITPTLWRGPERTPQIINGGEILELRTIDFVGMQNDFPMLPTRGEKIYAADGQAYEVRPLEANMPYRLTMGQIRIHTQKVNN
ncbi:MAG: hypothetical protein WCH39_01610 [Schlesneria sp.]